MVELAAGPLTLVLSPSVGGSIARFEHVTDGVAFPILRASDGQPADVLAAASFPLVPYVNRIRGGEFTFRGRTVCLRPNMAGDPSPLHGQGWLGKWTATESSADHAVLEFVHEAGEWPWKYAARQEVRLSPNALDVKLACRNLSDEPMPCGLGHHPYFNCGAATRIQTKVEDVWTIDENLLPVERIPATGRFDLTNRTVCGQGLDHGFGAWGGIARLTDAAWPFDIVMSSPDAGFFQLYSPSEGGIFVIEPVTHANAALNADERDWPSLGIKILKPGGTMSLSMRLEVNGGRTRART